MIDFDKQVKDDAQRLVSAFIVDAPLERVSASLPHAPKDPSIPRVDWSGGVYCTLTLPQGKESPDFVTHMRFSLPPGSKREQPPASLKVLFTIYAPKQLVARSRVELVDLQLSKATLDALLLKAFRLLVSIRDAEPSGTDASK